MYIKPKNAYVKCILNRKIKTRRKSPERPRNIQRNNRNTH